MRTLGSVALAGAMLLALASPVMASGPAAHDKYVVDYTLTADEFCGFPVAVHEWGNVITKEFEPGWLQKRTGHVDAVYTNPATGKWAEQSGSGPVIQRILSVDWQKDELVQILSFSGPMRVRSSGGTMVFADIGHVAYLQVWNAGGTELKSMEMLHQGGHMASLENPDAYCMAMTEALT